jgi:ATP-dependent Clp protease ATP-binding subunit ClpB
MTHRVTDALRANFKPEFLNRVDDIIIFQNLSPEHLDQIVDIQVRKLADRLADKQIELVLTDNARSFLARKGYDPVYGARPLKRTIQKHLENELSMEILKGSIQAGDRVSAEAQDDRIVFKIA